MMKKTENSRIYRNCIFEIKLDKICLRRIFNVFINEKKNFRKKEI